MFPGPPPRLAIEYQFHEFFPKILLGQEVKRCNPFGREIAESCPQVLPGSAVGAVIRSICHLSFFMTHGAFPSLRTQFSRLPHFGQAV